MAWTTPRTWVAAETTTAALMNTHVRDQFNILKTRIDDDGTLKTQLLGVAGVAGFGNVGAAETDATGYSFTIPADFLSDGESLECVGQFDLAANANAKRLGFYIGTSKRFFYSAAAIQVLGVVQAILVLPF